MQDPNKLIEECVEAPFRQRLVTDGYWPVTASAPTTLQLNLGYVCNQNCAHCHYESSPSRTEVMSRDTMEAALDFANRAGIKEFDLTGGAPEINPHFRWLVSVVRELDGQVTDRCNLTVLSTSQGKDKVNFLAANRVHVVASLPHYSIEITDRVRGRGVFDKSIDGLRALNAVGYGEPDTGLRLTLAHTPAGAILPGQQKSLESDYRDHLQNKYGIRFTGLITITNMPIGRFLQFLIKSGNLTGYMHKLERYYNPATLPCLMCRNTVSVGWDGTLYDCDFNQSLGIPIRNSNTIATVLNSDPASLQGREIRCDSHCYGCTAGYGSSCDGAIS